MFPKNNWLALWKPIVNNFAPIEIFGEDWSLLFRTTPVNIEFDFCKARDLYQNVISDPNTRKKHR